MSVSDSWKLVSKAKLFNTDISKISLTSEGLSILNHSGNKKVLC